MVALIERKSSCKTCEAIWSPKCAQHHNVGWPEAPDVLSTTMLGDLKPQMCSAPQCEAVWSPECAQHHNLRQSEVLNVLSTTILGSLKSWMCLALQYEAVWSPECAQHCNVRQSEVLNVFSTAIWGSLKPQMCPAPQIEAVCSSIAHLGQTCLLGYSSRWYTVFRMDLVVQILLYLVQACDVCLVNSCSFHIKEMFIA